MLHDKKMFPEAKKVQVYRRSAYSCLLQGWTYNYFTHYLLTYKNRKGEHGLWF